MKVAEAEAVILKTPEGAQAKRRLEALTRQINASKAKTSALFDERAEVVEQLMAMGVRQATISRVAGVSATAILLERKKRSNGG